MKRFCSRSCANTRPQNAATRALISVAMMARFGKTGVPYKKTKCKQCGSIFERVGKKVFCSVECSANNRAARTAKRRLHLDAMEVYRFECKFQFQLNKYPTAFDFDSLRKHGMYTAPNRGNNFNGLVRDHMVSIFYGFENSIPPEIIRHPANCQLLILSENSKKNKSCSISIEELYERIEQWEKLRD